MNRDETSGNWKQFKGKVKEKWGKLTDDDMTVIEGKRDQLVGKIQERYGYAKDEAEKEVSTWETENKDYRW
ncbi:CsbD family protein [[Erwinia] mediterraneensis]|uniref:CsbD family protein n=1 Tax=[Erwinia] mediterraneensis TaxID=2161819 RepID=UPI00102F592D|nr:CsbD family protein [[Erwinia] mediterraneensis]